MLKGIHPLLHADLLQALAAMGHGDELAIVDANFPAASLARRLLHVSGASASDALDAIPQSTPEKEQRAARMEQDENAGRMPETYDEQHRWIGNVRQRA
jgi:L-fucose mutarotase